MQRDRVVADPGGGERLLRVADVRDAVLRAQHGPGRRLDLLDQGHRLGDRLGIRRRVLGGYDGGRSPKAGGAETDCGSGGGTTSVGSGTISAIQASARTGSGRGGSGAR